MTKKSKDNILSIDIGGSKIKAAVLDNSGNPISDYIKLQTPKNASPKNVIKCIMELTAEFDSYDKLSVGFPGYVKHGIVHTAQNLGPKIWPGVDFGTMLSDKFGMPVRLLNDADMQGLGVIEGKGFEMVITLGTGFGTALFMDGRLQPHIELSRHPIKKDLDYDEYLGKATFLKIGIKRWNKRVKKVLETLKLVFFYDHLYIGGGNSEEINFKLNKDISLVTNEDGIKGGAVLWQNDEHYGIVV